MARPRETFDFEPVERAEGEAQMLVDVNGFEGPLDLLLELARRQKVDLTKISILALAEQYLLFIAEARRMRLELAADYLVMASWLAYLKSRLLLPHERGEAEPEAAELAADLAERLARLEKIRKAAQWFVGRERLGIDTFARGMPEPVVIQREPHWQVEIHDFLTAYLVRRVHQAASRVNIAARLVWSLQEARAALEKLVGRSIDWQLMDGFLDDLHLSPTDRRSARASSFAASLELAREGDIDLRQDKAFAPLYVRRRAPSPAVAAV